jgi:hypoxanthine-DNA glycosylase
VTVKRSFPPLADVDARLLVLGSLPGDRSLAAQRYYAHPQNQFWRLMSPVVSTDLFALDYDERLAILRQNRVALWDVVASARREGSTDAAILDASSNDLRGLVRTLPDLRAIAFNGATASRHGMKALGPLAEQFEIVSLPSSSPLHTIGLAVKLLEWARLAAYLR